MKLNFLIITRYLDDNNYKVSSLNMLLKDRNNFLANKINNLFFI